MFSLFQHLCSPPATESNKGTSHSDVQSVLARASQVLYLDNCFTPAVMAGYNSCPIDPSLTGSHRPPAAGWLGMTSRLTQNGPSGPQV